MAPNKHVRVVIRARPSAAFASDIIDLSSDKNILTGQERQAINIHIPKAADGGYINNQQEDWSFKFDRVLSNVSQEAVYEECGAPIVRSLLDGYNGTILAYGQTGAGKTFTMTGATENYKHRGLIPRAITHLFREISDRSSQLAVTVKCSYVEVYNETTIDLLKGGTPSEMPVVDDKNGSIVVKGLSQELATCEEDALNLLFEGETNRSIGDHALNRTSSRSHCIFTMHVEARNRIESSERVTCSKLNLVDLAGSERLSKTHSSGVTLKEAMYINKSLTFLEQVIIALADKKRDHIPFRQSRLTNMLRDSLGGNCNTLMVGNIWGERAQIEETISTLRFATRMMCVDTEPIVNVQYDPMAVIRKYEREIKELKQELAMHDTLSNRSHVQYEPFTEGQRSELQKKLKHWLDSKEEDSASLEVVSLRQIRESFNAFRAIYRAVETEKQDLLAASARNGSLLRLSVPGSSEHPGTADSLDRLSEREEDGSSNGSGAGGGVGETEGVGFGIGMAPMAARHASGKMIGVKIDKKPKSPAERPLDASRDPAAAAAKPVAEKDAGKKENKKAIAASTLEPTGRVDVLDASTLSPTRPPAPAVVDHFPDPAATSTVGPLSPTAHLIGQPPLPPIPSSASSRTVHQASPSNSRNALADTLPRPAKDEEFERFKRGKGADMSKALTENKIIQKEKKRQLVELTEKANACKLAVDALRSEIEQHRNERLENGEVHDPAIYGASDDTATAQEQAQLARVKQLKAEYRDLYDRIKHTKTEMGYASRVIDTCRQKLVADFEAWWAQTYPDVQRTADDEDGLDLSEQFDKMYLDKVRQEDPDSYAYYSALKNRRRETTLAKTKKAAR
ncbi:hypothetical protein RI367_008331 [Sorochytrium milnesiophthora]